MNIIYPDKAGQGSLKIKSAEFKQALRQIPAIFILAVLVGISVNYFRPSGISIMPKDGPIENHSIKIAESDMAISLAEAIDLFNSGTAIFTDARSKQQYSEGHIKGAVCIPFQEVDLYLNDALDKLMEAGTIVTYCDGDACDLSHELAMILKEMGFPNVRVLVNGWTVWQQAGLPTSDSVSDQGKDMD